MAAVEVTANIDGQSLVSASVAVRGCEVFEFSAPPTKAVSGQAAASKAFVCSSPVDIGREVVSDSRITKNFDFDTPVAGRTPR